MKLRQIITTTGLILSVVLFFVLSAKAAGGATIETAAILTLNGDAASSGMKKDNNVHWYKCTIPEDIGNQWVTFVCKNNMSERTEFTIYDDSEQALDSSDVDSKESWTLKCKIPDRNENEDFQTVEPGRTYYIKASCDDADSVSGKYSIQIKSVTDDNWGTFEQAPEFSIGQKTSGTLEMYGDIDMYKFTIPEIPEGKSLTYTLALAGSYYCTAAIIDADNLEKDSVPGSYERFSDSREITFDEGEGGTYYLKIYDASEDVTKTTYSFKLTKGSSSTNLSAPSAGNDSSGNDSSGNNSSGDDSSGDSSDSTLQIVKSDITVQAKQSSSKIYVVFLKGAKYVVTLNRKIIKKGKKTVKKLTKNNVTSGVLIIKLSKKLKKGDTIKVTVSKTGFKTKSRTVKVK